MATSASTVERDEIVNFFNGKIINSNEKNQSEYAIAIADMIAGGTMALNYTKQAYGKKYAIIISVGKITFMNRSFKDIKTNSRKWLQGFKDLYASKSLRSAEAKFFSFVGSIIYKEIEDLKEVKAQMDTIYGEHLADKEKAAETFEMCEAPTISSDSNIVEKLVIGMEDTDMIALGNIIASKSLMIKSHKGKYVELSCPSGLKVKVYIPKDDEQVSSEMPTINKYIVGIADKTAASMFKKEQMTALGQAIGLHAFNNVKYYKYIKKVAGNEAGEVRKHFFTMISLPKIKPHKHLSLTGNECLVWIATSLYKDVLNDISTKVKEPSTFARDTYSRMISAKIINEDNISSEKIEKFLKIIIAVCISAVNKRTQLPRSPRELMSRANARFLSRGLNRESTDSDQIAAQVFLEQESS